MYAFNNKALTVDNLDQAVVRDIITGKKITLEIIL